MFGKIPVHGFVAGQRQTDAGGDQAMRLFRGILANHGKSDLAGPHVLQPFATGDQFTIGRENRGNAHDVARRNACVSKRKLETGKPFTMFSDAFGEKYFLRDERHVAGCAVPPLLGVRIFSAVAK
jgi:hypothetical protein